jgi:hypothetical protein
VPSRTRPILLLGVGDELVSATLENEADASLENEATGSLCF